MKTLVRLLIALAAVDFLASQLRAESSSTGLIHQWNFNESSGTTAFDSVGTWNFQLNNGAAFAGGGFEGNAVNLDGIDDSIFAQTGDGTFMASEFTISMWERFGTAPSKLGLFELINGGSVVAVDLNYPRPIAALMVNSNWTFPQSPTLDDGQWHLITIIRTAQATSLYVDALKTASSVALSGSSATASFRIGQMGGTHFFGGLIDDVSIYNRALSPAEVAQAAAVPESSPALLAGLGIGILALRRRITG